MVAIVGDKELAMATNSSDGKNETEVGDGKRIPETRRDAVGLVGRLPERERLMRRRLGQTWRRQRVASRVPSKRRGVS